MHTSAADPRAHARCDRTEPSSIGPAFQTPGRAPSPRARSRQYARRGTGRSAPNAANSLLESRPGLPGAEPLSIECRSHLFAPFCLLRACCVCCVTNYSPANGRGVRVSKLTKWLIAKVDSCQPGFL